MTAESFYPEFSDPEADLGYSGLPTDDSAHLHIVRPTETTDDPGYFKAAEAADPTEANDISPDEAALEFERVKDLSLEVRAGIAAERKLALLPAGTSDSDLDRSAQAGFRAQTTLLTENLGLVRSIVVNEFASRGRSRAAYDHFDDLIAAGDLKLLLAIRTYDPLSGIRLSTYATRAIRNGIIDYLRQMRGPISYGAHPSTQQAQLRYHTEVFVLQHEREPTIEELVAIHNSWVDQEASRKKNPNLWRRTNLITAERVKDLRTVQQVSLSVVAGDRTESEMMGILSKRTSVAAEIGGLQAVVRTQAHEGLVSAIHNAQLYPLQKRIMFLRLMPEGALLTNAEVAVIIGSTEKAVGTYEHTARRRLRERAGPELRRLLELYDD